MLGALLRILAARVGRGAANLHLAAHVVLVGVPAWFAFVMAIPPSTYASSPRSFRVFAELMTEDTFALVCAAVAALGVAGMFARSRGFALTASAVLAAWHGFVALALLAGNPAGTGSGTYGWLAFLATVAMAERVRERN